MKKTATSQPKRVFPLHNRPFAILKNMFNDTGHVCCGKFLFEHFFNGFSSDNGFICDLMIDRILGVKNGNFFNVSAVKCIDKLQ